MSGGPRSTEDPLDVLIVGGGSAGLLLACLLAVRGANLAVIERRAEPGLRTRAIGIHAAALVVLDAVGIGDRVREEAALVRRGVALCRGRRLAGLMLDDAPVRTLPQHRTEALLAERLESLAPGALRRGETVTGLRSGEECVTARIETAGGVERERRARYAVGADGARSAVRGWIGAEWRARGRSAHYAMADEAGGPERSSGRTARLHLEPEGVVECFPLPDAGRRWVARLDRSAGALGRAEFAELVAARLGHGPDPAGLGEPTPFTAAQRLARPFARGRIALLGDAAHELSPIGGQGMNLGWLDAAVLAEELAGALEAGAPAAPFAAYARRRGAAVRAMRRAGVNTRLGAPVPAAALPLRNGLVRLLGAVPPVARSIVTIRR